MSGPSDTGDARLWRPEQLRDALRQVRGSAALAVDLRLPVRHGLHVERRFNSGQAMDSCRLVQGLWDTYL